MSHWNGFSLVPGLFRKWTSRSPILWPGGSFCHRSLLPPLLLSMRRRMGRACLLHTPFALSSCLGHPSILPACLPPSASGPSFIHGWECPRCPSAILGNSEPPSLGSSYLADFGPVLNVMTVCGSFGVAGDSSSSELSGKEAFGDHKE